MNEVRKLYNDDGCVLKEASSNDYESWSSARTLGPMERRKENRNLCYNFEYNRGTNIPHCAKKGVCDDHYFVKPKGRFFFWGIEYQNATIISGNFRKATVDELIEYFKTKEEQ